jgi:hypothetical protein
MDLIKSLADAFRKLREDVAQFKTNNASLKNQIKVIEYPDVCPWYSGQQSHQAEYGSPDKQGSLRV